MGSLWALESVGLATVDSPIAPSLPQLWLFLMDQRQELRWKKSNPKRATISFGFLRDRRNRWLVDSSPEKANRSVESRRRMAKEDTVKLISAEGFEFVIDMEAAMYSHTIRQMLTSPGWPIPSSYSRLLLGFWVLHVFFFFLVRDLICFVCAAQGGSPNRTIGRCVFRRLAPPFWRRSVSISTGLFITNGSISLLALIFCVFYFSFDHLKLIYGYC